MVWIILTEMFVRSLRSGVVSGLGCVGVWLQGLGEGVDC